MKIKLQINGESKDMRIGNYDNEISNPEYEIEMYIDDKKLPILEKLLARAICSSELFNWNIFEIKPRFEGTNTLQPSTNPLN
jgi:hypothetical protein